MKAGGGDIGSPPHHHTQRAKQVAKHRYKRTKTPLEWRIRAIKNKWYAFIKPDLRRRYRALQSLTRQNVENYIKKLR